MKFKDRWKILVLFLLLTMFYFEIPPFNEVHEYPACTDPPDKLINITLADNQTVQSTKYNLMFLKTHKTGTSTLVNVFYLYGIRRKLNFVLKPYNHWLGEISEDIRVKNLLQPRPGGCWNLQVGHGLFNSEGEHLVLPKNTSFYTTIVREPVSQFQSAFYYFGEQRRQANKHGKNLPQSTLMIKYLEGKRVLPTDVNSPATDMGWKRFSEQFKYIVSLEEKMTAFINYLDEEFDFIMISERLDESLVILKEYMGWELRDILYLNRNVVSKFTKDKIPEETREKILNHLQLDRMIFEHVTKSFERHIDRLGRERISEEVRKFRVLREEFENKCIDKGSRMQLKEWRSWGYPLTKYGKSENYACSFLQTNDMILDHAVTQLQLSHNYVAPVRGRATFDLQGVIMKLQYEHEMRYIRDLEAELRGDK